MPPRATRLPLRDVFCEPSPWTWLSWHIENTFPYHPSENTGSLMLSKIMLILVKFVEPLWISYQFNWKKEMFRRQARQWFGRDSLQTACTLSVYFILLAPCLDTSISGWFSFTVLCVFSSGVFRTLTLLKLFSVYEIIKNSFCSLSLCYINHQIFISWYIIRSYKV